ncbi:MAG: PD-(D/E)XK nuclease family protein [Oscillospiraceae bacterium]|nr:PD-(D/E)XK nuclease family protein [Candidatus Ruminococcus equi]
MLSFVLGQSGTGKTEYLYNKFCEEAKKGDNKLLFIVPDQCSFETEKVFLDRLGPMLCQNVKVFGFSRLCDYVFENMGMLYSSFADEGLRHVIMSLALDEVYDSLSLFSKRASSYDLAELMLNAVKEYKKCSISTAMLYEASERCTDEILSQKLYETALIYETYTALIEKSYIDPLDSLSKTAKILSDNNLFSGYTVAVDSFYGFTHQEYDVLECLIGQSKDIFFALESDCLNGKNGDLFFVCDRTRKRLSNIAKKLGVTIKPYEHLKDSHRFLSDDLLSLEQNVFRIEKTTSKCENIKVYNARSIFDEADFVARTISKLVMDEGYRYRDIAVVSREPDKYIGILDTAFDKYNINYFMDKPQEIDSKPIVRFCNCAFDIVNGGFDKDDVLSLLKTGLTSYSFEEIAEFENYLFVWDVTGKMFFEEFKGNPRGFADEFTKSDTAILKRVENMRGDIVKALQKFSVSVKNTDGKGISRALMNLLYDFKCKENIEKLCDFYEKNEDIGISQELVRMYNLLCDILDKMVNVIGDYSISPKRYSELLYTYFSNSEISFIPRGIDEVDVAGADRANLGSKKAVFVIGCNDSEFPRTPVESGVFTDTERKTLMSLDLSVSDSIEELSKTEKFLAYKALTSAREKLFVSHYISTISGQRVSPSEITAEISDIFSNMEVLRDDQILIEERLYSEESAFEYLCDRYYSKDGGDIKKLYDCFKDEEKYSHILSIINNELCDEKTSIKDKKLSFRLFANDTKLSASQIEKYYACKFQYFCYYGLNVKERKKASMDALEYGTMMHYLLQHFFEKHKESDFSNISEKEIKDDVNEILGGYFSNHFGDESDKTKRFMYLYSRMITTAEKLIKHICEELAQCKFTPTDFELSIGEDIPLYTLKVNDDFSVSVKGSIDRVDVLNIDGKDYVRIVDYKTGTKEFSLSDIVYGINLQMLIYMSAIQKNGEEYFKKKMTPAGVLYMPAVSPSFNVEQGDTKDDIERKNNEKYRMQGILLDDIDVIKSMEKEAQGVYIPVVLSDDVVKKGGNCLATLSEMGALFKKIDLLITDMAQTLANGEIEENPTRKDTTHNACDWCAYKSVCSHTEDDEYREIKKLKKDEVFEKIFEEVGEDE